MTARADAQLPSPGEAVVLFQLDCTPIGGQVYYFTSSVLEPTAGQAGYVPVRFGGIEYTPVAIVADGFEATGRGSLPTPRLSMSAQLSSIVSALLSLDNFLGAILTRIRTFRRYLDDGASPDPSQTFPPDRFVVSRLVEDSPAKISWELKAVVDVENAQIPRRKCLRDYCSWRYRVWNGSAFVMPEAVDGCPYTGSSYWTALGVSTSNPALDQCGKTLKDCRRRFPGAVAVPFGGMPGVE